MQGLALKLIVGLGNPGEEYARTRHNAGFWFADELARRHGGTFRSESRYKAEVARVRVSGMELWLLKPMSYMNRSGGPTSAFAGFYKIAPEELLVAHDEIDLPPGTVRLKQGGGHGGNNGLRDCIAQLGESFWRLRFGVGHPGSKELVHDHVLSRAGPEEEELIRATVNAAADALPLLLEEGAQKTMNRLHSR